MGLVIIGMRMHLIGMRGPKEIGEKGSERRVKEERGVKGERRERL